MQYVTAMSFLFIHEGFLEKVEDPKNETLYILKESILWSWVCLAD